MGKYGTVELQHLPFVDVTLKDGGADFQICRPSLKRVMQILNSEAPAGGQFKIYFSQSNHFKVKISTSVQSWGCQLRFGTKKAKIR